MGKALERKKKIGFNFMNFDFSIIFFYRAKCIPDYAVDVLTDQIYDVLLIIVYHRLLLLYAMLLCRS